MDKNNKFLLKVIAFFGTFIIIIIAVFAWLSYSNYKREQKANEELYKAMEEDRKYLNEQQQKEAEERLKMLHDILTIDAQRGENEED